MSAGRLPQTIVVITPAWVTGTPLSSLMHLEAHPDLRCDVCDRSGLLYVEPIDSSCPVPNGGFAAHLECIGASEGIGVYVMLGADDTSDPVVLAVLGALYEPRHAVGA